jgi:hypothetical protein
VLDEAALARAQRLAGLKGYITNIPAAVMPAAEVISSYHQRDGAPCTAGRAYRRPRTWAAWRLSTSTMDLCGAPVVRICTMIAVVAGRLSIASAATFSSSQPISRVKVTQSHPRREKWQPPLSVRYAWYVAERVAGKHDYVKR